MAVLQMQRITICALKKDRKQLLEFLQRKGVVEITNEISEDIVKMYEFIKSKVESN